MGAGGGGTQFGRLSTLAMTGSTNLTGLNSFSFNANNQPVSTNAAVGRVFGSAAPASFAQDVTFNQSLAGLNIANGEQFSLTFTYNRGTGSGSAQGIALGNFSAGFSAVPEPSSMALLTLGGMFGGVAQWRRRRCRKALTVA